jgi:hypothetical protein
VREYTVFLLRTTLLIFAGRLCQVARSVINCLDCCCMTLLIEHMIILLAEEVCGSWGLPGCMDSQIYNQMLLFLVILSPHCCVISLRGQQKGERIYAHVRVSARGSLE